MGEFDINAWLSGLSRVTKFVEVIGKPHLQAEIDALDAHLRRVSDAADAHGIAEQIEALRVEMEASRVGFRVSSLDPERVEAILAEPVSYTHLRAHETVLDLVCRLLLEKKKTNTTTQQHTNNTNSFYKYHL